MSKSKKTKARHRPQPPAPATLAARRKTTWRKIRENWATWLISVIMALSLLGRCAGPSARRRAASNQASASPTAVAVRTATASPPAGAGNEIVTGRLSLPDGSTPHPSFEYHLTVPSSWRGHYETETSGNAATFIYDASASQKIPLFTVAAYSEPEWAQLQTQPDFHGEKLLAKDGVVFVDTLLLDSASAGTQDQNLQRLSDEIPKILGSFEATPVS